MSPSGFANIGMVKLVHWPSGRLVAMLDLEVISAGPTSSWATLEYEVQAFCDPVPRHNRGLWPLLHRCQRQATRSGPRGTLNRVVVVVVI